MEQTYDVIPNGREAIVQLEETKGRLLYTSVVFQLRILGFEEVCVGTVVRRARPRDTACFFRSAPIID
jgi:hypothetical protein